MEAVDIVMQQDIYNKLSSEFKTSKDVIEFYEKYYHEVILVNVRKMYLSHLTTSIEEIINNKLKHENKKLLADSNSIESAVKNARRFSIILIPGNTKGKAKTYSCEYGAAVYYNPNIDDKDLRILVAHELGHIVNKHIFGSEADNDNTANVFAFFAVNGKSEFYKTKAANYIYSSEIEIISKISAVCPICRS
jgi:hypothetical protein